MSAWAAALIGVGGTLAGAALGGWFTYASERERWFRDQSSRWADERRRIYAEVIVQCNYIAIDAQANLLDKEGATFRDWIDELRPARNQLRILIADLELIGSDVDADAAHDLLESAEMLVAKAVQDPDAPALPALKDWRDALDDFKRQARAGLHLTPPARSSIGLPRRRRGSRSTGTG